MKFERKVEEWIKTSDANDDSQQLGVLEDQILPSGKKGSTFTSVRLETCQQACLEITYVGKILGNLDYECASNQAVLLFQMFNLCSESLFDSMAEYSY